MRSVSPTPPELGTSDEATPESTQVAAVAYTAGNLVKLVREKLPCWRWAAFASVLVQRRAPLQARLRDSALGFTDVDCGAAAHRRRGEVLRDRTHGRALPARRSRSKASCWHRHSSVCSATPTTRAPPTPTASSTSPTG